MVLTSHSRPPHTRMQRTRTVVQRRATVYFEAEIHRALRLKAAASERSISDLVNDAVKLTLTEDR